MTALQADHRSSLAATMLPGLIALLESKRPSLSPGAQAALDLLKGWDLSTPTGLDAAGNPQPGATQSYAASVFHAFQKRFASAVLADDLARFTVVNPTTHQPKALDPSDIPVYQLAKILSGVVQAPPPSPPLATGTTLCQTGGSGTCADRAAAALEATVQFLGAKLGADPSTWSWGRLHQVSFPPLAPLLAADVFGSTFRFGPFPNDGGLFTVDVADFDLWAHDPSNADVNTNDLVPYVQSIGPNVRFSAEMDPAGVKWRAVIPGGEVDRPGILGLPADPHYEDQIPAWLANEPGDQPFTQADVIKAATKQIVFSK
jgi:acyl-homoserine lactone acylase PvdQ